MTRIVILGSGFAVGDLRGALWVEVPAATPATAASTP